MTLNGGTLRTSSGSSSLNGTVTLGANSIVDVTGTRLTLSGVISGSDFGFTKTGSGELTLSAANTYTGATLISSGMITVTNPAVFGTNTGGITISSGATLQLDGGVDIITIQDDISVAGSGVGGNGAIRLISGDAKLSG